MGGRCGPNPPRQRITQEMLNATSELANRYHIKFGKAKSQSMTINGKTPNTEITIGEQVLEKNQHIQIPRYDHK